MNRQFIKDLNKLLSKLVGGTFSLFYKCYDIFYFTLSHYDLHIYRTLVYIWLQQTEADVVLITWVLLWQFCLVTLYCVPSWWWNTNLPQFTEFRFWSFNVRIHIDSLLLLQSSLLKPTTKIQPQLCFCKKRSCSRIRFSVNIMRLCW